MDDEGNREVLAEALDFIIALQDLAGVFLEMDNIKRELSSGLVVGDHRFIELQANFTALLQGAISSMYFLVSRLSGNHLLLLSDELGIDMRELTGLAQRHREELLKKLEQQEGGVIVPGT